MEREHEHEDVAPESQRKTLPNPMPFTGSVGAYLIVNESARSRRRALRDPRVPSRPR